MQSVALLSIESMVLLGSFRDERDVPCDGAVGCVEHDLDHLDLIWEILNRY